MYIKIWLPPTFFCAHIYINRRDFFLTFTLVTFNAYYTPFDIRAGPPVADEVGGGGWGLMGRRWVGGSAIFVSPIFRNRFIRFAFMLKHKPDADMPMPRLYPKTPIETRGRNIYISAMTVCGV